MEDLSGKQFGHYQIVAPLGEGGMAAVYKAYQPSMERYVAIKVLPRHMATSDEFVNRFRREAKLLAQLQHPHILPVFDYGEAEGYTYIVMPMVSGGTLADLLHKRRLSLSEARQFMVQIGDALSYAHARGMIHRDIKPSNVLIDERGNCLLTDFGLARMAEASTKITSSGAIMGTPAYMSPEQGAGVEIDHRSDIYSLGIILYEMVTGRVPYTAETPVAIIFKHIQDPLPSARKLNPDLPVSVESVLLKALAKTPEDRYQTAEEFVRAIQTAIPDVAPGQKTAVPAYAVPSKPVPPKTSQPIKKWILPAGVLAVICALALGALLIGGQMISQLSPAPSSVAVTETMTSVPSAITTDSPEFTSVPLATTAPVTDNISEYLNDVQVIDTDTFDNPRDDRWDIMVGTIKDGALEITGNDNWDGVSYNGKLGEGEAIVIDFNYSADSLYEIFVDNGEWDTDQYKRFGIYIGSNQAEVNQWAGRDEQGGATLPGNLSLESDTTYSFLLAILPGGELLEVVWDPANPSEKLSYRKKFDQTWSGLTWTLELDANKGAIQFDNFKEIQFSGAK